MGYQVPPGISDATVPNPVFNLTPAATVDEGNNWINISWGPLAQTNSVTNVTLGNYALAAGSPAINYIPSSAAANFAEAPSFDFFNHPRKADGAVDAGAVEFAGSPATGPTAAASVTGGPLAFGNVPSGTTASRQLVLHNTGTAPLTGITLAFSPRFTRPAGVAGGTCGTTLTAAGTCTINVVFSPNAIAPFTGTLTITASVPVTGSPVTLGGTGTQPLGRLGFALVTPAPTGVTLGTVLGVPTLQFGTPTAAVTAHVTVSNTAAAGSAAVVIGNLAFAGTGYTQTNNCPIGGAGLAVGATCTLNVTFTPPTPAALRTGAYVFTDNGLGTILGVQLLPVTGR